MTKPCSCPFCKKVVSCNTPALETDVDGDYTLVQENAWITVGWLSVNVVKLEDGVAVSVYNLGRENDDPLDNLIVFEDNTQKEEDKK